MECPKVARKLADFLVTLVKKILAWRASMKERSSEESWKMHGIVPMESLLSLRNVFFSFQSPEMRGRICLFYLAVMTKKSGPDLLTNQKTLCQHKLWRPAAPHRGAGPHKRRCKHGARCPNGRLQETDRGAKFRGETW